jgi:hypothetical protein
MLPTKMREKMSSSVENASIKEIGASRRQIYGRLKSTKNR